MQVAKLAPVFILIAAILEVAIGIIFIDRHTLDYDAKLSNWSITIVHNQKKNSMTTLEFQTFVTFTKMLLYVTVKIAENQHDREYRRELVKTVIDVVRFTEATQNHPIGKLYLENLKKSIQFKVAYPLKPVILH